MGKCLYLILIPPVFQSYFIWKCWLIWFRLRSFSRKGPYGLAMQSRPTLTFTLRKWSTSSRMWRTTWWVDYKFNKLKYDVSYLIAQWCKHSLCGTISFSRFVSMACCSNIGSTKGVRLGWTTCLSGLKVKVWVVNIGWLTPAGRGVLFCQNVFDSIDGHSEVTIKSSQSSLFG